MRFEHFLPTSLLLVGTSSCGLDNKPRAGLYGVMSDCPGAAKTTGTLELAEVSSLLGGMTITGAMDFGFPSESFLYAVGGSFSTVTISNRSCEAQLFEKKSSQFIFLCKDGDSVICTITMRQ